MCNVCTYVYMHVCCCWIQEGRLAKEKQTKLYSNNALFKVSTARWLSVSKQLDHKSHKVTLPNLLLILQPLSQWFSRHLRWAPQYTPHPCSAICRCCLSGQGLCFSSPVNGAIPPCNRTTRCDCCTRCNWILFCCVAVLLNMHFLCVYQWKLTDCAWS